MTAAGLRRRIAALALAGAALAAVPSCSKSPTEPEPRPVVHRTVTAVLRDSLGNPLPSETLVWTSQFAVDGLITIFEASTDAEGECAVVIAEGARRQVEEEVLVQEDEIVEGLQVASAGRGDQAVFVGQGEDESFHTYFIPPRCYKPVSGMSRFCNREYLVYFFPTGNRTVKTVPRGSSCRERTSMEPPCR